MKIAMEVAKHVDKVRINPGLFVFEKADPSRTEYTFDEFEAIKKTILKRFTPLVELLKEQKSS